MSWSLQGGRERRAGEVGTLTQKKGAGVQESASQHNSVNAHTPLDCTIKNG